MQVNFNMVTVLLSMCTRQKCRHHVTPAVCPACSPVRLLMLGDVQTVAGTAVLLHAMLQY